MVALCSHAGHLYTSTTLGCILVLDADTMNPVSVLQSHHSTVRLLLPLQSIQPSSTIDVDRLSASSSGKLVYIILEMGWWHVFHFSVLPMQNHSELGILDKVVF